MNATLPISDPWTCVFFVDGDPAPGGSKTVIHRWKRDGKLVTFWKNGREMPMFVVTDDAGERNKAWRKIVAWVGKTYWQKPPTERPLEVQMIFFLRRPACHFGTGRNRGQLLPSAPVYHVQKPDALKLARSTEDALTGIVWVDDAQVVRGPAPEKRWAGPLEKAGAIIRIRVL